MGQPFGIFDFNRQRKAGSDFKVESAGIGNGDVTGQGINREGTVGVASGNRVGIGIASIRIDHATRIADCASVRGVFIKTERPIRREDRGFVQIRDVDRDGRCLQIHRRIGHFDGQRVCGRAFVVQQRTIIDGDFTRRAVNGKHTTGIAVGDGKRV